ncbi:MAG: gamma-glutamyl-gamma-aminobutyrate hydrolase family protein [Alphaproteobacteria bacterium]|nr:gamma-glutamyl-gamma-aminobutyrate hydrolase family protein [Alphaproteobacteria bacterium]
MTAPIIGITADREDPGGYSKFPWYALRVNYCSAVQAAGGIPIILPPDARLIDRYAEMIDGLIVSGGAFDVDPALFGEKAVHDTVVLKTDRTDFELGLTKKFLADDRPVFGICGGQQLLAVALGGTLIQHIPDEVDKALAHEQPNPRDEAGHDVTITPGTRLHDIVGSDTLAVNSAHHQAVKAVPSNIVIDAMASDGVIEGIEDPSKRWCIGVQWHPEFHISDGDRRLYDSFIKASS